MKKEFACPERPWKSTNNASNVPIISPNGTLSSGLGLHKRSGILFMTDYLTENVPGQLVINLASLDTKRQMRQDQINDGGTSLPAKPRANLMSGHFL
jgi:hypothetical protein